jgi:transposase-like protein
MDNVTFILVAGSDGIEVEHAIIDRGNGEFTSMPKSEYDRQQAEQFTPSLAVDETKTK